MKHHPLPPRCADSLLLWNSGPRWQQVLHWSTQILLHSETNTVKMLSSQIMLCPSTDDSLLPMKGQPLRSVTVVKGDYSQPCSESLLLSTYISCTINSLTTVFRAYSMTWVWVNYLFYLSLSLTALV